MSTPANTVARRAALLEAAALCDRMADDAIEEANGAFDPAPESRDAYARADTRRIAHEEAASHLVAARDQLRKMAAEPVAPNEIGVDGGGHRERGRIMSRPLIFLDVDGVLVTGRSVGTRVPFEGRTLSAFDPESVTCLNVLVEESGAEVVLSSTWRLLGTLGYLNRYFSSQGCTFELSSVTGVSDAKVDRRGDEILAWRTSHAALARPFVIVDDDSDMGALLPYLVQTDFETGMQAKHVIRALGLLAALATAEGRS